MIYSDKPDFNVTVIRIKKKLSQNLTSKHLQLLCLILYFSDCKFGKFNKLHKYDLSIHNLIKIIQKLQAKLKKKVNN